MPQTITDLKRTVARLQAKYPADFAADDADPIGVAIEYLNFLDHAADHFRSNLSMNLAAQAAGKR